MELDIAKILAMSEGEQQKWWEEQTSVTYGCGNCLYEVAFRLRDEAMETEETRERFHNALYEIQVHLGENDEWLTAALWAYGFARPIDWILAALKAKEK
jgi:hypothetical protein